MIQMCHLKALNQVLITFCETAILECTLKVVGHFASWSHCARGAIQIRTTCAAENNSPLFLSLPPSLPHVIQTIIKSEPLLLSPLSAPGTLA